MQASCYLAHLKLQRSKTIYVFVQKLYFLIKRYSNKYKCMGISRDRYCKNKMKHKVSREILLQNSNFTWVIRIELDYPGRKYTERMVATISTHKRTLLTFCGAYRVHLKVWIPASLFHRKIVFYLSIWSSEEQRPLAGF